MLFSRFPFMHKMVSFNSSAYLVKQHNTCLIWDARLTVHVYWPDLDMIGKWPPTYASCLYLFFVCVMKFVTHNSILFHSLTNNFDCPMTKVLSCLLFYWLPFLLFQISTTSLSKYLILSTYIKVTNVLNKLQLFLKS